MILFFSCLIDQQVRRRGRIVGAWGGIDVRGRIDFPGCSGVRLEYFKRKVCAKDEPRQFSYLIRSIFTSDLL